MGPQKHYFLRHLGASKIAWTKARFTKARFPRSRDVPTPTLDDDLLTALTGCFEDHKRFGNDDQPTVCSWRYEHCSSRDRKAIHGCSYVWHILWHPHCDRLLMLPSLSGRPTPSIHLLGHAVPHSVVLGSQHPSPNVKNFPRFEPQIWPESITSRDAENTCFKGSRTSCDVIIFGIFFPNFGRKISHHVMDALPKCLPGA